MNASMSRTVTLETPLMVFVSNTSKVREEDRIIFDEARNMVTVGSLRLAIKDLIRAPAVVNGEVTLASKRYRVATPATPMTQEILDKLRSAWETRDQKPVSVPAPGLTTNARSGKRLEGRGGAMRSDRVRATEDDEKKGAKATANTRSATPSTRPPATSSTALDSGSTRRSLPDKAPRSIAYRPFNSLGLSSRPTQRGGAKTYQGGNRGSVADGSKGGARAAISATRLGLHSDGTNWLDARKGITGESNGGVHDDWRRGYSSSAQKNSPSTMFRGQKSSGGVKRGLDTGDPEDGDQRQKRAAKSQRTVSPREPVIPSGAGERALSEIHDQSLDWSASARAPMGHTRQRSETALGLAPPQHPLSALCNRRLEERTLHDEERVPRFEGFKNHGNSCYLNACLQAILCLPGFVTDIRRKCWVEAMLKTEEGSAGDSKEGSGQAEGSPTFDLYKALLRLSLEARGPHGVMDSSPIKRAISRHTCRFAGNRQEDAHELFAKLIGSLHEETSRQVGAVACRVGTDAAKGTSRSSTERVSPAALDNRTADGTSVGHSWDARSGVGAGQDHEHDAVERMSAAATPTGGSAGGRGDGGAGGTTDGPATPESAVSEEEQAASILPTTRHFHAEVEVILTCTGCGYSRRRTEMYRDFSVDIPDSLSGQDGVPGLDQMLDAFFSSRELQLKCEKCGHDGVRMDYSIGKLPGILVVHIKRFKHKALSTPAPTSPTAQLAGPDVAAGSAPHGSQANPKTSVGWRHPGSATRRPLSPFGGGNKADPPAGWGRWDRGQALASQAGGKLSGTTDSKGPAGLSKRLDGGVSYVKQVSPVSVPPGLDLQRFCTDFTRNAPEDDLGQCVDDLEAAGLAQEASTTAGAPRDASSSAAPQSPPRREGGGDYDKLARDDGHYKSGREQARRVERPNKQRWREDAVDLTQQEGWSNREVDRAKHVRRDRSPGAAGPAGRTVADKARTGISAARRRELQHEIEQLQEAIRLSREEEEARQRSAAGSSGSLSMVQREEEDLQKALLLSVSDQDGEDKDKEKAVPTTPSPERERGGGGPGMTGRWECPQCTTRNELGAASCQACFSPKPPSPPLAKENGQKQPSRRDSFRTPPTNSTTISSPRTPRKDALRSKYRLRAVVHHIGESPTGGHYITDVAGMAPRSRSAKSKGAGGGGKGSPGVRSQGDGGTEQLPTPTPTSWKRYDDRLVFPVSQKTALEGPARSTSYLCFYSKDD